MITPIVSQEELLRRQRAGQVPVPVPKPAQFPAFATPQVQPQMQAQSDPGVFDRFRTMLSDPGVRTMLMQTGMSLLQPTYQGTVPHIAQSIGQGMAAMGRRETRLATEQKEQEALDREIEKQRIELGLKAADSESLGARRAAMTAADRARLGIESGKAASRFGVDRAQEANYASMIKDREGELALKGELGRQRNELLQGKNALAQKRYELTKLRDQAKDKREIDKQIAAIDEATNRHNDALTKIAAEDARLDKKLQAKLIEGSMKAGAEASLFDPDVDMEAFAKGQGQLYRNLTKEFGFPQSGGPTTGPKVVRTPEDYAQVQIGEQYMVPGETKPRTKTAR